MDNQIVLQDAFSFRELAEQCEALSENGPPKKLCEHLTVMAAAVTRHPLQSIQPSPWPSPPILLPPSPSHPSPLAAAITTSERERVITAPIHDDEALSSKHRQLAQAVLDWQDTGDEEEEEEQWRFGIGGLCDGNSTWDVNWLCHSNQAAGWQMKCVSFTPSLSHPSSSSFYPPPPSHFSSLSGWRKKRGVHVGALDSNTITFLFSSPACLFYLLGSPACHAR